MRQIEEQEQLNYYLHAHQIDYVFNENLLQYLSLHKFGEEGIICEQGGPRSPSIYKRRGKIIIFNISSEGNKLILAFKSPLEIVGDLEFIQDIEMINTVEAVTPGYMIG